MAKQKPVPRWTLRDVECCLNMTGYMVRVHLGELEETEKWAGQVFRSGVITRVTTDLMDEIQKRHERFSHPPEKWITRNQWCNQWRAGASTILQLIAEHPPRPGEHGRFYNSVGGVSEHYSPKYVARLAQYRVDRRCRR